jgi:hypothetical protein
MVALHFELEHKARATRDWRGMWKSGVMLS